MRTAKTAIAIKSCHKNSDRRVSQLETWLKNVDTDFFFVVGEPVPKGSDFLYVTGAPDDFNNIAPKVLGAVEYALENNVEHLLVVDDDTYVYWPRMVVSDFDFDYVGFVRNYTDTPYMQGSCFWLSQRSMSAVVKNKKYMTEGVTDDGAIGRCLYGEVPFTHEHRYAVGSPYPEPQQWPRLDNNIIASHKMNFMTMHACHDSLS